MKTQEPVDSQEPDHRKRSGASGPATLGAVLVVILIVGASFIVYAQLANHHKGQASAPIPGGTWTNVLQGYTLTSLHAAANDPSVLYACAMNSSASNTPANGASSPISSTTPVTVLSSSDYGTHWQNIGANIGLTPNCQLAVNPDNSNELYVIGATQTQNGQAINVLKHSTDGGQTWTTITPSLKSASGQITPMWRMQVGNLQQISMVAGRLFAIEVVPFKVLPPVKAGGVPPYMNQLPRLITSSDGGQSWTIIDQSLNSSEHGVSSYVVDPTNANTIYTLMGQNWFPLLQPQPRQGTANPLPAINAALYKTTDGGVTWKLLLQNLAFGTSVQLASGDPQIIYVGGSRLPLPYAAPNGTLIQQGIGIAQGIGLFSLQVSNDGGTSWQQVPNLPQTPYVDNWLVSQNGQVYIHSGSMVMQPQATPAAAQELIQRYDPASKQWSSVTKPPINGTLLAVTPTSTSTTNDSLWYVGVAQGQDVLYRYVA